MSNKRKITSLSETANKRQKIDDTTAHDPARWWRGSIDPHAVGDQTDRCPINWDQVPLNETDAQMLIDIYELRSPWKPTPDNSLPDCQAQLNQKHGKKLGVEAWRKKFMKTNLAVYKSLGIWFEQHPTGLQDHVGRPPRVQHGEKAPPKRKRPNAQKCADELFTIRLLEPGTPLERWRGEATRVSVKIARDISPWLAEAIESGYRNGFMTAERQIIDYLFSCFAPRRHLRLPQYGHRLTQADNYEWVYEDWTANFPQVDLFELFASAAGLGCTLVCDMTIDRWHEILKEEIQLREEFQTGKRPWASVPTRERPDILAFESSHMNLLWSVTGEGDCARQFWLDVIAFKGEIGHEKIKSDLAQYCEEFVNSWRATLNTERNAEIEALLNEVAAKTAPEAASTNEDNSSPDEDLFSDSSSDLDSDSDSNSVSDSWSKSEAPRAKPKASPSACQNRGKQRQILGESDLTTKSAGEHIDRQFFQALDYEPIVYDINNDWHTEKPRPTLVPASGTGNTHSMLRTEGQQVDPRQKPATLQGSLATNMLPSYSTETLCHLYHNHRGHGTPCHLSNADASTSHDDGGLSLPKVEPLAHHVAMTIGGTPGFIIRNHTGDCNRIFQVYPTYYPDWDWERVRAVHQYEQLRGDKDCRVPRRLSSFDPTPVYFFDHDRDELGRFPSHPGYMNPEWDDAGNDGGDESEDDFADPC